MPLAFVLPGPIGTLTGGFLYDKRIIDGVRAQGVAVDVVELPGDFPRPDAQAQQSAAAAFAAVPDDRVTVVDGLALAALPGVALAQGPRLKLIALVHHPLAEETGLHEAERSRLREQETRALSAVRGAITSSTHTAEALSAYGLSPERVRVVNPGVDPRPLARGSGGDRLELLTVGTVTPRKGHLDLVEALASLRHLDWRLTCIGNTIRDPGTSRRLNARIEALGLANRIRVLGERDPGELAEHYAASDLFVLASYHEGYGMALGEALGSGLPIVSTTAGAIPGTVPRSAGLLVPPGDRAGLAEALLRAITDRALRRRLAEGARQARRNLIGWTEASGRFRRALLELCAS